MSLLLLCSTGRQYTRPAHFLATREALGAGPEKDARGQGRSESHGDGDGAASLHLNAFSGSEKAVRFGHKRSRIGTVGDRTYKLGSGTTSGYGRYVKSLGDPVTRTSAERDLSRSILDV